eukprot:TRINITY_DN85979_c0_g1_i1.p1 TRINITY_DN85979_c0_g1~~TRINITY_DN85979_c0_g1_i1.p1  ORF type:complete len:363 (-),score=67.57 TRINITY_DN85979_c0_g1_i1:8-1042(-)
MSMQLHIPSLVSLLFLVLFVATGGVQPRGGSSTLPALAAQQNATEAVTSGPPDQARQHGLWLQQMMTSLRQLPALPFTAKAASDISFGGAATANPEVPASLRLPLGLVSGVLTSCAAYFHSLGSEYAKASDQASTGGSEHYNRKALARSPLFHYLFAAIALILAAARLAPLWGLQPPVPLPWLSLGRLLAAALMALTLGLATGARVAHCLPGATLAAGAWAQLGAAAVASDASLQWGLFGSGAVSGFVSHMTVEAGRSSELPEKMQERLRVVFDLVHASSILMLLTWLGTFGSFHSLREGTHPISSCVINGINDILFAGGTGHLMLKSKGALDEIFRYRARAES